MKVVFRVFSSLVFAYLALELAAEVRAQRPPHCPPCDVRRCENTTLVQESCPHAGLVMDTCACCRICGSIFGEPCGGAYGYLGTCEYDLKCTVDPSEYLNGANISGVCTRKVCMKNCTKKKEKRVCGDDGRWFRNICSLRQNKYCNGTGVSVAPSRQVCDRACHLLEAPEHGNISFSKGIAQTSVANISCQPPYILDGDQLRTCMEGPRGAAWNGTQPQCRDPCELHRCESYHVCVLDESNAPQCICGNLTQCLGEQSGWVCAVNGVSHRSRCHFRVTACQTPELGLYIVSEGKCNSRKQDNFSGKRKR